ncbi:MAG: glycine cleavage system aminomethyltransferase GcvT, partial [Magnetospiraceae bacterium]
MAQQPTQDTKRTPLYDLHLSLGAKMVPFAGWEMPIQYGGGIIAEHTQSRTKAALFDVSHMGQVILSGAGVHRAMEALVPSVIDGLPLGKARYTVLTNETGGILDDLIVSNLGEDLFLVVNAAMRNRDIAHLRCHLPGITLTELTNRALLALQGPEAENILAPLGPAVVDLRFMETLETDLLGETCRISRLGYTGEDGFELSVPDHKAEEIAQALLAHPDCGPAGLGARDTLRLEAGLCLYGHDIDDMTSPVAANLTWVMQKRRRAEGGFPGAGVILRELEEGPRRKLVGLRPQGRAPARQGTTVQNAQGESIGMVTSGGYGPTVGGPVAMGYVEAAFAEPGTAVTL